MNSRHSSQSSSTISSDSSTSTLHPIKRGSTFVEQSSDLDSVLHRGASRILQECSERSSNHSQFDTAADGVEIQTEESFYAQYKYLHSRVLFCLYQFVPIRKFSISLIRCRWFDRLTMCVILLNCLMMTLYTHCENEGFCSWKCSMFALMDHLIFIYFTCEMVFKIIAMGVLGKKGYLYDFWNKLDCFIVVTGFIEYLVKFFMKGDLKLTVLKILQIIRRILRPLRAVNRIPSMRVVAGLVLRTIPMLANVLLLCFLVFFVFGIIAVQLWAGLWRNRCVIADPYIANISSQLGLNEFYLAAGEDYVCSKPGYHGLHACQEHELWNTTTDENTICNQSLHDYPQWENGLPVQDAYFCIDWNQYYTSCITSSENLYQGALNFDNIFYASVTIFVVISMAGWSDIMYYVQDSHSFWDLIYFITLVVIGSIFTVNLFLVVMTTYFSSSEARELTRLEYEKLNAASFDESDAESLGSQEDLDEIKSSRYAFMVHKITWAIRHFYHEVFQKHFQKEEYEIFTQEHEKKRFISYMLRKGILKDENKMLILKGGKMFHRAIEEKIRQLRLQKTRFGRFRLKAEKIVQDKRFTKLVLIAITLNAFTMAIVHHNQPNWLDVVLELCNYIFTAFFTIELVIKITGLGLFGYLKDPFNMFDGIIVITSLVEIFQTGSGGIQVLRTFRLLRLVKLIHFMPAFREMFAILASTMDEVAVFLALLALVIFIFSLSGTILFGNRLCMMKDDSIPCDCSDLADPNIKCTCERVNFDTFLNSSLTVFQTITTEDWNSILVNCMSMVSEVQAVIYFVSLFFVGNYIMMNLVVAILVQGCMEMRQKKRAENKKKMEDKLKQLDYTSHSDDRKDCTDSEEPDIFRSAITHPSFAIVLDPPEESVSLVTAMDQLCVDDNAEETNFQTSNAQRDIQDHLDVSRLGRKFNRPYFKVQPMFQDGPMTHEASVHNQLFHSNAERQNGEYSAGYDSTSQTDHPQNKVMWKRLLEVPLAGTYGVCLPCQKKYGHVNERPVALLDKWPDGDIIITSDTKKSESKLQKISGQARSWFHSTSIYQKFFARKASQKCKRWDYSFFLFSKTNPVRVACINLVTNECFDYTILFLIFLNCIAMAFERPSLKDGSFERVLLNTVNIIFTLIFLVEMILKQIAMGVIFGERAYLKSAWNVLDGTLVLITVVSILGEFYARGQAQDILGVLRVLRVLRALRPLRMIQRAKGLRVTAMSLMKSVKDLGNILLICAMFYLIFGILGVQMFKGYLYHCEGPNIDNITTRAECETDYHNVWVNAKYNFDDIIQALLTLYVVSTMDGWVDIMHNTIDAVGIDMQHQYNYAEWRSIYFVSFIVLMSFLVMNMAIGVLVDNYYEVNDKIKEEAKEKQRREIELLKQGVARKKSYQSMSLKEKIALKRQDTVNKLKKLKGKDSEEAKGMFDSGQYNNYGLYSLHIRDVISHTNFDILIAIIILLNILVMATEHYDMSPKWQEFHRVTNYIFTAIFIIEAALKIYGYTFKGYIAIAWNRIDLAIVVISIIGIIVQEFSDTGLASNTKLLRILRMARIVRVVKLLKQARGFMKLMDTFLKALPQVSNLFVLFGLQLFIFSAVGVELFGRIACTPQHPCEGMSEHAHFKDFGMAFLTLFRCATGDAWSAIMEDTMKTECDRSPGCTEDCCVNPFLSSLYFITFTLMAQFILLNIVVAVLMKGFEDAAEEQTQGDMLNTIKTTSILMNRKPSVEELNGDAKSEELDSDDEATHFYELSGSDIQVYAEHRSDSSKSSSSFSD